MSGYLRGLLSRSRSRKRTESRPNSPHANAVCDSPSFPDGVKVLHDCADAAVDICFVHGLTGDRESTWTAHGHSEPWPKTLLPEKLNNSRILTYGYDAYVVRKGVAGSNRLLDHATNLLNDLTADRDLNGASSRPLIFVAHSLGGLVCKKAILLSRNNPDDHLCGIFDCIKGIIFMGTPHKGSWMADWAKIPSSALGLAKFANKSLLEILQTDNQLLESDQHEFWSMVRGLREGGRRFEVACAFEELPLPVAGKVVSNQSATLEGYASFSIHANHSDMVRFASAEENGFKRLLSVLTRWKSQLEPVAQPPPLSEASQACLQSLSFPQMQDRSHDIDNAAAGTCEWLLRHEKYTAWAACDLGLLWIKGKPGSGKSTVLKYALSNHKTTDGALILSFFFHGRGDELQKNPLGFFRSLLHQILEQAPDALQDLVGVFESKCKRNGRPGAGWHWHEAELRPFLQASVLRVLRTRPTWLFVDALDECGKDNAVRLVGVFNTLLKSLASQSEVFQQFHICFSCRHYPILDVDESRFEVCTEHENHKDISAFVDDKLAAFRTGASSKIPDLITARASGVFMWARLVVEQILDLERDGAGPAQMEAVIYSIPPSLDELYRQLVQGMGARSKKLIQWVSFAIRPLNLNELRWAMVIDADCPNRSLQVYKSAEYYVADSARMKRQAQTLSRGLVEVTHTQTVQFIHQSVKDFFFEKDFSVLGGGKTLTEAAIRAHLRFSKICLRYLAMEEISQVASDLIEDNFPFLRYAVTSWTVHAEQYDTGSVPQDDLLALLAWPSNALVESWVRVYRILDDSHGNCPGEGGNLVHIASEYRLVGLLTAILQMGFEIDSHIDSKDARGQTPLMVAIWNGHEAIVRLLLETGDIDTNVKDDNGRTPLSRAAENGHEAIIRLLLETGNIDTNAKDDDGWTPLMRAILNRQETLVQLLLETGNIDTNAKDDDGWTPLIRAIVNGHEAIVQLLLETGNIDTNAKDDDGWTPLMRAALYGHEAIVRLLLETDNTDTNAKDDDGWTPLMVAIWNGHEAIVRLLLETDNIDINPKDSYGRTPLMWAASYGREATVRLLLEIDNVDTNAKDDEGRTPLSRATENGHEAIVQLLESAGGVY